MSFQPRLLPLKDAIRYSKRLRRAGATAWLLRGLITADTHLRTVCLAKALTLAEDPPLQKSIIKAIGLRPGFADAGPWEKALETEPRYQKVLRDSTQLTRSIVLKAPGTDGEKGALLMTFEYNWVRLLLGLSERERQWIDDHYDLVLSTSWSPTDYAVLGMAAASMKSTLFVQSCNYGEISAIEAFHPRLKCLPTLPCDWINPSLYAPRPAAERETDIVMVANWGAFKRHWELFRALQKMPAGLKVVLIGQREPGRSRESILTLAQSFGVPQKLEIHESLPIAEVARHQCNAKVSVILSRREGCCVAAVESLFAGCALAMREDAHVGPLAYINENTGRRLRPDRLHLDLLELLEASSKLRPEKWAVEHLACSLSKEKLNAVLKAEAVRCGRPWTQDIAQAHWRPHPTHAHDEDRKHLAPAYAELNQRFPRVFAATLMDTSWK